MQNGTFSLKDGLTVSKLNVLLPEDPVITLLGIERNQLKTYIHAKICTQMFIAFLFIIDQSSGENRHTQLATN